MNDNNIMMPHQTDEWNAFDDDPKPRKRWVFDWRSYWLGVVVALIMFAVVSCVQ